jgi:exodeoxyribonuclease-3
VRSRQALSFYFYLIALDSSRDNVGSQSNVPLEVVADLTPVRTDPGMKNACFAALWGDRNGTLWPVYSYRRSDALLLARIKRKSMKIRACYKKLELKIATFNINNVNRGLPHLLSWLKVSRPDVVCLQELKSTDADFPARVIEKAGYHSIWLGQKTWNGVAILSREAKPILTRNALPGDPDDTQSRYIEAAVNGILIGCIYLPNGNPQPGPKFHYKLEWFNRLAAHAKRLLARDVPAALAGDFNVAPTPQDIYPTRSWDNDALVQPESRHSYAALLSKDGPMPSARCIRINQCIRSGITCGTAGLVTLACGSIICFSARR